MSKIEGSTYGKGHLPVSPKGQGGGSIREVGKGLLLRYLTYSCNQGINYFLQVPSTLPHWRLCFRHMDFSGNVQTIALAFSCIVNFMLPV